MTATSEKHTQGQMRVGTSTGHTANHVYVNGEAVAQVYGIPSNCHLDDVDPVRNGEGLANAARIVLTWNCHDELVEACRCALGHLTGNMDGDMDLGDPAELLRAALSRATSPTP